MHFPVILREFFNSVLVSKRRPCSSATPTLTTRQESIGLSCTWRMQSMENSLTLSADRPTILNDNCNYWIFNDRHLQSAISRFCGHYCIFYCLFRCRGSTVNAIANKLTLDIGLNEYLIHQYICGFIK